MSTYTTSLGLELITPGSQAGLWGNTTNNTFTLIDQAVTGVTPISFASASGTTRTLTDYNGAVDEARAAVINITGSATGSNTIVIPNKQKMYLVRNSTGQNVVFQTASPVATYTVGAGYSILVFCDGNNNVFTGIAAPSVGTLTVSGGGTGATTFTAGFVKSPGGTSNLTTASTVALASDVSGTLPVANGGTGVTSFTSGAVILGNGSGNLGTVTASTNGYVLTWDSGTSSWKAAAPATGVSSFSAGTTGLSPSIATTGAVTLGGTLNVATGGTGVSTFSAGFVKSGGGTTALTTSSSVALGSEVSGTLPVTNGGTGAATFTAGFVKSGGGTTALTTASSIALGSEVSGTLPATNGGTGQTTYAVGDLLYASTTTALSKLADVATGNALISGGVGVAPSYGKIGLATHVSGTLPTANGGTNLTSFTSGGAVYATSTSALTTGTLPVASGGTGSTTASGARTNLGLGSMATQNTSAYGPLAGVNTWTDVNTFQSDVTINGTATCVSWNMASTTSIYYNSASHYVGIAIENVFPFNFYTTGNATASGTWQSLSDARLKENVTSLPSVLDKVSLLNPVKFSMKSDSLTEANRFGLIAQELEQVFPTVVNDTGTDKDGVTNVKAVSYTELIPVLVKAIQELKAEVDALKAGK